MTPYMYPGFLPYQTVMLPSYQESAYIQQTLIASTQSTVAPAVAPAVAPNLTVGAAKPQRARGETLVAKNRKLPDGRPFPRDYETDSLRSERPVSLT